MCSAEDPVDMQHQVTMRMASQQIRNHQVKSLIAGLNDLRKKGCYMGVILECQGGEISAHRNVLCANSPYFFEMFNSNMTEANSSRIEFKDIPVQAMEVFVRFLYGNDIPLDMHEDEEMLQEVLKIAHLTQTFPLFKYCWKGLIEPINSSNFIKIWRLSVQYKQTNDHKRVLQFIVDNMVDILAGDAILQLTAKEMNEFVSYALKAISGSNDLAKLIVKWGKAKPKEKMSEVVVLFKLGDFNLSNKYIYETLTKDMFVKNSADLKDIFTNYGISKLSGSQPTSIQGIQIHFYSQVDNESRMNNQIFCLKEMKWYVKDAIQLPVDISTQWIPLMTPSGDRFYFAISKDKNFVAYEQKTDTVYFGPSTMPTLGNYICGEVNGIFMYLHTFPCIIVQFNTEIKTWKQLANIDIKHHYSRLQFSRSKVFFYCWQSNSIHSYDCVSDKWCLKTTTRKFLIPIIAKCFSADCKKRLYFMDHYFCQLFSYCPVSDSWEVKKIPDFKDKLVIYMNCCQQLILFCEINNPANFWLYFVMSNEWQQVPNVKPQLAVKARMYIDKTNLMLFKFELNKALLFTKI
uniref:BTB domain-containing protein n=1 Tax=Strigamia maritima TaxID=126957 RepID=T1IJQ7_STRMM